MSIRDLQITMMESGGFAVRPGTERGVAFVTAHAGLFAHVDASGVHFVEALRNPEFLDAVPADFTYAPLTVVEVRPMRAPILRPEEAPVSSPVPADDDFRGEIWVGIAFAGIGGLGALGWALLRVTGAA